MISGPPYHCHCYTPSCQHRPEHSGPTTHATQLPSQYHLLQRTNPRRLREHHSHDLVDFVKSSQQKEECIILAGDCNEVIGLSPAGMTRLCHECHLYDLVLDKHNVTGFSTYQRDKDVLDYILADDSMRRTIVSAGYGPFRLHIPSDHRRLHISVLWKLYPASSADASTRSILQTPPSDRLIAASRHAGTRLKKSPPAPYSPALARLGIIQRV
jgi:hypothetical protein